MKKHRPTVYIELSAKIYGGASLPGIATTVCPPHAMFAVRLGRWRFKGAKRINVNEVAAKNLGFAGAKRLWITTPAVVQGMEAINVTIATFMKSKIADVLLRPNPLLIKLPGRYSGGTMMQQPLNYRRTRRG